MRCSCSCSAWQWWSHCRQGQHLECRVAQALPAAQQSGYVETRSSPLPELGQELYATQMPQAASIMAVPDADDAHLEQLPPQDAEQPVGMASVLPAVAERGEDVPHPSNAGGAPPVGAAAKDNALPDGSDEDTGEPPSVKWDYLASLGDSNRGHDCCGTRG